VQYEIEINGRVRRAVVHRAHGGFVVDIDGRQWKVDAEPVDGQSLSLLIDDAVGTSSHEATIVPGAPGQLVVSVGATSVSLSLNGRARSKSRGVVGRAGDGPQRITAPMPGKVVRVLVKPGDEVSAREPVVVIEAMKMENELRAARPGRVTEIHVREGQSVEAGGLLAVIAEPSK